MKSFILLASILLLPSVSFASHDTSGNKFNTRVNNFSNLKNGLRFQQLSRETPPENVSSTSKIVRTGFRPPKNQVRFQTSGERIQFINPSQMKNKINNQNFRPPRSHNRIRTTSDRLRTTPSFEPGKIIRKGFRGHNKSIPKRRYYRSSPHSLDQEMSGTVKRKRMRY